MDNKKLLLGIICSGFLCMGAVMAGQQQKEYQPVYATTPDVVIASDQDMIDFVDACNAGTNFEGQLVRLDADVSITLTKQPTNDKTNKIYSVFAGEFDGNNHTITLDINTSNTATGIWRNINGNVHDLNLEGTITNSGTYASPLCLYNNGTIRNVSSSITANLPTVDYVSGLVFRNNSSGIISSCSFSGNITGNNYVGGITSDNQRYIGYCENSGSVNGSAYVGGITATLDKNKDLSNTSKLQVTNCINSGSVSGQYIGGIAYSLSRGSINNCSNSGNFTGTSDVGGIAYKISGGEIVSCSNSGNISGAGHVAGIVSYYVDGSLSNCTNTGNVSSTAQYLGGIVSIMGTFNDSTKDSIDLTLSNCINKGSISGLSDCGGVVGFAYPNTKVLYCSNYGTVTSSSTRSGIGNGGIVGSINSACTTEGAQTLIRYCYNGGRIITKGLGGGILGLVSSGTTPIVELVDNLSTGFIECTRTSGNANIGTLVGYAANNGLLTISNSWAIAGYSVKSGVAAGTYGYGVGAGGASSDASSKATSSSDDFRYVIQFIREYTCSEDASTFKTKYNGLSTTEKDLLDQVTYFDELTGSNPKVFNQTYKQAACYIAGEQHEGVNSALRLFFDNEQNTTWIIIVAITSVSVVALIIIIRKKKAS